MLKKIFPSSLLCFKKRGITSPNKANFRSFKVGLVNPTSNKIWQNRYWEHTILDEKDLNIHLDYIHYNPVKHNLVESVKCWKYSSFNKFVKNGFYEEMWGSYKDIENIKDLNFE